MMTLEERRAYDKARLESGRLRPESPSSRTQRRLYRIRNRLCTDCGKELPANGWPYQLCEPHREIRNAKHRRNYEARKSTKQRPEGRTGESPKWDALEATMAFACDTCGLRGEHECIPRSAAELAENRNGPGRTYPTGGV